MNTLFPSDIAVVPILVGPLQVLLATLPAILIGLGSALLALLKPRTFKLAIKILWRLKVSVLIAIAVIGGTVIAARAVWRNLAGKIGKAEADSLDWPAFRGNARRTGAVAGSPSPLQGGINWAFSSDAKTFHSSPTIVGNRLYVTSAEIGVFSSRGAIYCLDADTGGVVWKTVPEGFRPTFSSPSVSGKYLVTGEGLHKTRDGRICCLDVSRGGALLWTYATKSHVESSPAIANGRAYIGAGDDGYYCFELEPDSHGKPVMAWHLPAENYPDAESDPIGHEGRVYFGLGIGGQALVCADAASGKELWRVPTPFPVFSPPAIARGKIFVGMGNGDFVFSSEELLDQEMEKLRASGANETALAARKAEWKSNGELWCIDLATHRVEWRFTTDRTVLGAVLAGEDRLYCASRGGTVYSVGFDGRQIASWNARAPVVASLAVTPSHVYAATNTGRLFALGSTDLQPVWETSLGSAGTFLSSPVIARGHVYIGSPEDGLLCIGQPAGAPTGPLWAGHLGGAGVGGNLDRSALPAHGDLVWRWPEDPAEVPAITAPAAAMNNRLFVPVAGGARHGLLCLRADKLVQQWFSETPLGLGTSPAAFGNHVAFVDGAGGDKGRNLHFINATTGATTWLSAVGADASGISCLTSDAVLIEDQPGRLTSFDLSGGTRWREPLDEAHRDSKHPRLAGPPAIFESLIIATTAAPGTLLALDEAEGKILWSMALEETPLTGPVVYRNIILFGTATGFNAHSVVDGKRLWHAAVGEVRAALVLAGNSVCTVNAAGELVILNPMTGKLRAKQSGAIPNIPPMPAPDALLYVSAAGLMRYDLGKNTAELWMPGDGFGSITSPVIMSDSSVYFATEKRGFIRAGRIEK